MDMIRIGIDIMGGDFAPNKTIEGSILAAKDISDNIELVLIGDEDLIKKNSSNETFPLINFKSFMPPM